MAGWSARYLAALEARDARESAHKPYIDAYTRLADGKNTAASSTATTPTPQNDAEIQRLRADLTTTQKHRSTLQTQLNTLNTTHTTLISQNSTLSTQLASTHRQLQAAERRIRDRDEEIKEQRRLIQDVQDEQVGLNMELNIMGAEKERLEKENRELVRRWMERMGVEAERVNREGGWS